MLIPGPFLGTIKSMSTKKWRGPSDDELRTMVVIPDYLSRDMANAVATEGAATPEGPSADEKAMAPITPILVFINSRSGGRLGPELMSHFEDLISSNQVRNSGIMLFTISLCPFVSLFSNLIMDEDVLY